jgi:hypothetical protein
MWGRLATCGRLAIGLPEAPIAPKEAPQRVTACCYVGQAILPAAAFLGGFSSHKRVFAPSTRRLKAGGSQDWRPHKTQALRIIYE